MTPNTNNSTFISALYRKYCDDGPLDVLELEQNDGHKRVLEYVGLDKLMDSLKNVTNLPFINLPNMDISSCGEVDRAKFNLHRVRSLDLAFNKLSTWQEVSQIVTLTKALSTLVLTSNPLSVASEQELQSIGPVFHKLHEIVLGNLAYSWNDVCQCALLWPNVEKLNLFGNSIVQLSHLENILQNLTFLSLSKNSISDWSEICKLGNLSKLETLELSNCKITSIYFPDTIGEPTSVKTKLFPELNYLDLLNNQINDWKSVAQLNRLAKLNCLLLKKNPLYDLNQYYYNFNHVISRIAGLKTLDREPIKKEARNDGEKYYLRTIYPEYLEKCEKPEALLQFLEENPCFLQLIERFGEPVVAKKLTKQDKIKQNFLNLKISDPVNVEESKRLIEKQVPISTKVSNLKFILRRLLKIDMSQDFNLIITGKDYEEEMHDRNEINIYRVDTDHEIVVKRL